MRERQTISNILQKYGYRSGSTIILAAALLLLITPLLSVAETSNAVKISVPPYPGDRVKAEVVKQVLDTIGYKTYKTSLSWVISLKSVATGEFDVDFGLWRPTQNSVLEPLLKKGVVEIAAVNVKDAKYGMVVPQYVCDAGVTSIDDLSKYPAKFESKIYGIDAGNDGNEIVKNAIRKNTYKLSGWRLVPSSTAAMLTQAQRAIQKHKWIVFLGWEPHWMNVVMDLCYLKDPQKIWGGGSTINTIVNTKFVKAHPNIATFLKNFVIPASVQSDWIYTYSYKHVKLEETASDWIENNVDKVTKWLANVKTPNGKPAIKVFEAKYNPD